MSSSIADEITRLSGCRDDILSAISAKGVTIPEGAVLSSCPELIGSIQTGGGGDTPTALVNTGVSAWVSGVVTGTYTADQLVQQSWVQLTDFDTSNPWDDNKYAAGPWSSISGCVGLQIQGCSAHHSFSIGSTSVISAMSSKGSYWPVITKKITWTGSSETSIEGKSDEGWTNSSQFAELSPGQDVFIMASVAYVAASATAVTGLAIDDGNGALPYPDRPKTETGSVAVSASAYQWQNSNSFGTKYIDRDGYESSRITDYATPTKLWDWNSAAQRASIHNTLTSYYPPTAYTFSEGNVRPTVSASGNWW